jgi:hypothetical protein
MVLLSPLLFVVAFLVAAAKLSPALLPALGALLLIVGYFAWRERAHDKMIKKLDSLDQAPWWAFGGLMATGLITLGLKVPITPLWIVAAMWLAGLGFEAPNVANETRQAAKWGFVAFFAFLLAITPALHLPIGLDGQQARFAYFGSAFTSIMVVSLSGRAGQWRYPVAAALVGLNVWQLSIATSNWTRVGQLSNDTVKTIGTMKDADRIVVLGAPAVINGALLFMGGLDQVPRVMYGSNAKVETILKMHQALETDKWIWQEVEPNTFGVKLDKGTGYRVLPLQLMPPTEKVDADVQPQERIALVKLNNVTDKTRIMIIGPDGVKVIR